MSLMVDYPFDNPYRFIAHSPLNTQLAMDSRQQYSIYSILSRNKRPTNNAASSLDSVSLRFSSPATTSSRPSTRSSCSSAISAKKAQYEREDLSYSRDRERNKKQKKKKQRILEVWKRKAEDEKFPPLNFWPRRSRRSQEPSKRVQKRTPLAGREWSTTLKLEVGLRTVE